MPLVIDTEIEKLKKVESLEDLIRLKFEYSEIVKSLSDHIKEERSLDFDELNKVRFFEKLCANRIDDLQNQGIFLDSIFRKQTD